jgi:hypothetical protein
MVGQPHWQTLQERSVCVYDERDVEGLTKHDSTSITSLPLSRFSIGNKQLIGTWCESAAAGPGVLPPTTCKTELVGDGPDRTGQLIV